MGASPLSGPLQDAGDTLRFGANFRADVSLREEKVVPRRVTQKRRVRGKQRKAGAEAGLIAEQTNLQSRSSVDELQEAAALIAPEIVSGAASRQDGQSGGSEREAELAPRETEKSECAKVGLGSGDSEQRGPLRHGGVKKLLAELLRLRHFTLPWLLKHVDEYNVRQNLQAQRMPKPSANDVEAMAQLPIFASGDVPLVGKDQPLRPDSIAENHASLAGCERCIRSWKDNKQLDPTCYFARIHRCLANGWCVRKLLDESQIWRQYGDGSNSKLVEIFSGAVRVEVEKLLKTGAIREVSPGSSTLKSPLNVVIKPSDKARAAAVGVVVDSQASLDEANARLGALILKLVKTRLAHDLSASRVNASAPEAPFRATDFSDIIAHVERGGVLAKTDIVSYFNQFPLDESSRRFFGFEFEGKEYEYNVCGFGFKLSPAYCDTFSAEILRWVRVGKAIEAVAGFCDDFITAGPDTEKVLRQLREIKDVIESTGMATAKDEWGHVLEYLGRVIDLINMRVSISPEKIRGERLLFQKYFDEKLSKGLEVPRSVARHYAGLLNWYGEILASARLYSHIWWIYAEKGKRLSHAERHELMTSCTWFLKTLQQLEEGTDADRQYRIYSSAELLANPSSIYCCTSDESGPDGLGFFHGSLTEPNPRFVSVTWEHVSEVDESRDGYSSGAKELYALLFALRGELAELRDTIVLWTTDSQAAFYALNKGSSSSDQCRRIIAATLSLCDERKIYLVALWVPREDNELADFLSHLATTQNRPKVVGRLSDLGGFDGEGSGGAVAYLSEEEQADDRK